MVKRMLIDATHPEETRVVVVNGTRLEELDVETSTKKQLKGNIYLAKIVRVACGRRKILTTTSVTIPRRPSLPTSAPMRS